MVAYGITADAVDKYSRISEPVATKCLEKVTLGSIHAYGNEYLRSLRSRYQSVLKQKGDKWWIGKANGKIVPKHMLDSIVEWTTDCRPWF